MRDDFPSFLANLNPDIYLENRYLVLDFEVDTSHEDYGHPAYPDNKMLLACWKFPGSDARKTCVWGGEHDMDALLFAVQMASFIVCHNCKYELGWLHRIGADLRNIFVYDTKIGEYVLLGNMAAPSEYGAPQLETSLDMVCRRRRLPIKDPAVDVMIGNGINPVRIPRPWLEGRCRQDVATTEQVFLTQRQELKERGLLPVQYTRCLLTPVLAAIEQEGMSLDAERVEEVYDEYRNKLVSLERQMQEFTGGINWRSPDQSAKFLYDTLGFAEVRTGRGSKPCQTPGGKRCTDAKILERLTPTTDRQRQFLALRKEIGKVAAALSKALEFYIGVVREKGGTFYAELNQTTTATHRLSSSGAPLKFEMFEKPKSAQFQNQPRVFKRLFRAKRPGWLMADPDGSSLEFRVAAELGGPDVAALADIESGWDVHVFTASILNDKSLEEIKHDNDIAGKEKRDSLRQLAKPDTFKPLYGGSRGTAAQERYYAAFRARYPGIAETQESWANEVARNKSLRTPWGLIYYWPTARGYGNTLNVRTAVYNYPIQALATAEIIPTAVVYLWHRVGLEGLDALIKIVNLVHDNAPAEIHPDVQDQFVVLAKQAFTRDVYRYLEKVYGLSFRVPLGVGIKIGSHWGEGKEFQFNVWKDGQREVQIK